MGVGAELSVVVAESGPLVPSATAPSVVVSVWSMLLSWMPVAMASADTSWLIAAVWSVIACDSEPFESRLALTAASIGATMLAFSATARSIGAAPSIARSTSAARSRIETTSLSGSAVTPSTLSSSVVIGANSSVLIGSPSLARDVSCRA